jgi:hypothetical protein
VLRRSFEVLRGIPGDAGVPDRTRRYVEDDFANHYDNALLGIELLFSGLPDGIAKAREILEYFQSLNRVPDRSAPGPRTIPRPPSMRWWRRRRAL